MKAHGQAHKYGDNIDTDVIIPARYLNTSDPKELGALSLIHIFHSWCRCITAPITDLIQHIDNY